MYSLVYVNKTKADRYYRGGTRNLVWHKGP